MGVSAYTLFSSSSGNCVFITDGSASFLIDAGCSAKRINAALASLGASFDDIDAVFITHEHRDHVDALRVLTRKRCPRIHATEQSAPFVPAEHVTAHPMIYTEKIGGFTVSSFPCSHDSACCVGYVAEHESGVKLAEATDTGYITNGMRRALTGCGAVILESNYDERMLLTGPYPYELKMRIMSDRGHLCNDESAGFLPYLYANGTRRVLLAHISPENNTPETALAAADRSVKANGLDGMSVAAASGSEITRLI